jgi:hypothetical protein
LALVGELELLLVDRIVSTAWRLRRLVAVETMLFDREDKPDAALNGYGREKMGVLSRYEVTLERSLYKALHELQRLQAARDGQAVPLPEAVDVERIGFAWRKHTNFQFGSQRRELTLID